MKNKVKKVAIAVDSFHPYKTSAAIQVAELMQEFANLGIEVTIFTPSSSLTKFSRPKTAKIFGGEVVYIKTSSQKANKRVMRAIREIILPLQLIYGFSRGNHMKKDWDYVIWYSPSIFLSFFIDYLCRASRVKSYLILRDIFPQWAFDTGLIKKGLVFSFFKWVEKYQYRLADKIGIQTKGDLSYFRREKIVKLKKIEVLNNWKSKPVMKPYKSVINQSQIKDRKIFIYSGNMGIAQNLEVFLRAAEILVSFDDIGFLFVGDGSEKYKMKEFVQSRALDNCLILDSIDYEFLPSVYSECHFGIISLDPNLTTHNIPGKFLSYLYAGLPTMANGNAGNDLQLLIEEYQVGVYCSEQDAQIIAGHIKNMADSPYPSDFNLKCDKLLDKYFSSRSAAIQILEALEELDD